MSRENRLHAFVGATCFVAAVAGAGAWITQAPFPGWWPLCAFLLVACALEGLSTQLRLAAKGSTSFIIHMATALLFGAWWAVVVAGISTVLGEFSRANTPLKLVFNVAQRVVSVVLAVAVYQALGGQLPPSYLVAQPTWSSSAVQADLGLFFVFAATYFLINSALVSWAVALSSDRSFREVWNFNTRGVLAYDIGASAISLLVAWLYVRSQLWFGFGSLGLLGVVIPVVAIRHVYGLYHQLQDSGQELLQVMVKAIEARDPYTSGHSVRVSKLSRTIAVELGLPAAAVEQIETAALLHDVGKIHEEFAPLLRKESRLTDAETALMQTHSARSAELVGIISKFRGFIQDSVRSHHERWDGKGYPDGLVGERIPIGARIILVSDTIDAMTTDRPYRKRLQPEAVFLELQKCRGSQFDPMVVDIVISSVAVRRLIAEPHSSNTDARAALAPRRLSWPSTRVWRARA
jgi:HD-GYP domain-containing protein (c-di-GMP phosphodiesterase class II)